MEMSSSSCSYHGYRQALNVGTCCSEWHPAFALWWITLMLNGSSQSSGILGTGRFSGSVHMDNFVFVWAVMDSTLLQEVLGAFSSLPRNVLGITAVFSLDAPQTWSCEMMSVSCSHLGEKCEFLSCNMSRACFTDDGMVGTVNTLGFGVRGEELHYVLSNLSKVTWTRILF